MDTSRACGVRFYTSPSFFHIVTKPIQTLFIASDEAFQVLTVNETSCSRSHSSISGFDDVVRWKSPRPTVAFLNICSRNPEYGRFSGLRSTQIIYNPSFRKNKRKGSTFASKFECIELKKSTRHCKYVNINNNNTTKKTVLILYQERTYEMLILYAVTLKKQPLLQACGAQRVLVG